MASPTMGAGYPLTLDLDAPYEVQRWRALFNWILAIPHLIVLYVLQIISALLQIVSFFTVLFTKQVPEGIYGFQVMTLRYNWRVQSFTLFLRNPYPPFSFDMVNEDNGIDPAKLSVRRPAELNRWLPLIKWLLLIPHYIALIVLAIALVVVWIIGFFAVLILGRWPEGLREFVVGYQRWWSRVMAYHLLLVDDYPPFSLS